MNLPKNNWGGGKPGDFFSQLRNRQLSADRSSMKKNWYGYPKNDNEWEGWSYRLSLGFYLPISGKCIWTINYWKNFHLWVFISRTMEDKLHTSCLFEIFICGFPTGGMFPQGRIVVSHRLSFSNLEPPPPPKKSVWRTAFFFSPENQLLINGLPWSQSRKTRFWQKKTKHVTCVNIGGDQLSPSMFFFHLSVCALWLTKDWLKKNFVCWTC